MSTQPGPSGVLPRSGVPIGRQPADLRLNKGASAYHAIKRQIMLAELEPGSPLAEQTLAHGFGVSQGTVREALMRLERDGLVARRGYRGTVVTATSMVEAAQMVKIRIDIECAGVDQTAGRLGQAPREALLAIIAEMDVAHQAADAYACSELDRRFHLELFAAAGLPALSPILGRCALHMHRFTVNGRPEFFEESGVSSEHRQLLHTIEADGVETARRTLTDHIMAVVERWSPDLVAAIAA